jgi:hypothetical protein
MLCELLVPSALSFKHIYEQLEHFLIAYSAAENSAGWEYLCQDVLTSGFWT